MQLKSIKRGFIIEAAVIGAIIAIFAAIYVLISSQENSAQNNLSTIKRETQQLGSNIRQSKKHITDLADAISLYKSIPQNRLPTETGLAKDAIRIREARSRLEPFRQAYKFNALDVTFSRIIPDDSISDALKNYSVFSSEIDLSFSASSDEVIFSFIYDMLNKFQGYLRLNELSINKKSDVWDTVTEVSSQQNEGLGGEIEPFNFVSGTAKFSWRTIEGDPVKIDFEKILADEGLL